MPSLVIDLTGDAISSLELPESYQKDLHQATEVLKAVGCTEVYLFGSLVDGRVHERSDVDLAVRGCPKSRFFQALGDLMMKLDHRVDLVDLDGDDLFAKHLEKRGELVRIG